MRNELILINQIIAAGVSKKHFRKSREAKLKDNELGTNDFICNWLAGAKYGVSIVQKQLIEQLKRSRRLR